MDIDESFKDNPDWSDVTPIYHSEIEDAVVRIKYSDRFREVFAYFRALVQADERSERALRLCTCAAFQNPANYTVWQYRRNVLQSLKSDLKVEMKFISEVIQENPKNYQVWHHRRVLIEWTGETSEELAFTELILHDDAKNYHAWQHRQWVVETYKLWGSGQEVNFSTQLIADDLRNNSAWNYRFFVVSNTTGFTEEVLEQEVRFTLEVIQKAPHNESSWNYLCGILMEKGLGSSSLVAEFCTSLYEGSKHRSPHLLSFMVDALGDKMETRHEGGGDGGEDRHTYALQAIKLLDELQQLDPTRRKYWLYKRRGIENGVTA